MVAFTRFIALAAVAGSAMAVLTPIQITSNIKQLTTTSRNLQGPANSITALSSVEYALGTGPFPEILAGFNTLVKDVQGFLQKLPGTKKQTPKEQQNIFVAFRSFVQVHQTLLGILIGKASILQNLPLIGAPLSQVLKELEGLADSLTLALISIAQTEAGGFKKQKGLLDGSLNQCAAAYQPIIAKSMPKRSYPIALEALEVEVEA